MEQYWLAITLIVTFSIGIVAFINKIFAERKYDVKFSTLMLFAIMFSFSLISWIVIWFSSFSELGAKNILLCLVWWGQIYSYSFIMMSALKYLPTSTYFITARLASSFLLLMVGMLFFWDQISWKEAVGFLFGVGAMSLLFEKEWNKHEKYKTGILFLILGIISLVLGHSITKVLSFELTYIPTILSLTFFSASTIALIFWYKNIKANMKYFQEIWKVNLMQSIFYFVYFYALFYVYNFGDLGISYKIQSYSPFIPIILAAIVYKEKISLKKSIAIVLTVLSLYFFT